MVCVSMFIHLVVQPSLAHLTEYVFFVRYVQWDPKLTTLPGLYLFSIGITGPVAWLLGENSISKEHDLPAIPTDDAINTGLEF